MRTESTDPKASGHPQVKVWVAIAALLATAFLAACGSSGSSTQSSLPTSILNTSKVETSIEQSILAQRHLHATVSCPKVVPQEKGRNFNCLARVGKAKTVFAVTQTDDNGHVTYRAR